VQLVVRGEDVARDREPALRHRPPGTHLCGEGARFAEELVGPAGVDAQEQLPVTPHRDRQLPVDHERQAAEHADLADLSPVGETRAHPPGEVVIVGHRVTDRPRP
jgi:hypothetical protein